MNARQTAKIEILPESVKHMIAAGEVVQGPFSVIKELVENAIDAGADSIDIMTRDGGLSCIRVIDNGCGIASDQIALSVVEHATSKIRAIADIETIASYGFRGEALSSIASVSRLSISSRQKGAQSGARLISVFGEVSIEEYQGQNGTSVLVEELFYNTPARKKFLKSQQSESRNSLRVVSALALARPGIAFSYRNDDRLIYDCPAVESLKERIQQLFGPKETAHLIEGSINDIEVGISGCISDGSLNKPTRAGQYLFVNNRPIENASFSFHIRRAYDSLMAAGKHPHAYINISLPPGLADVNVHPAKREIRFFDEAYMGSLVYGFCRSLLDRTFSIIRNDGLNSAGQGQVIEEPDAGQNLPDANKVYESPSPYVQAHPFIPSSATTKAPETPALFNETLHISANPFQSDSFTIYGTLFSTYVLAAVNDEMLIIDFHAAHERIIYDRLIRGDEDYDRQLLLEPKLIHFPAHCRGYIDEVLELLVKSGFDTELFSDDSFVVRSVPGILHVDESDAFFEELLNEDKNNSSFIIDRKKLLLERVACHSAKRAGDTMTNDDMKELVHLLFFNEQKHELRCPHGRPFVFRLTRTELEKFFSRRV